MLSTITLLLCSCAAVPAAGSPNETAAVPAEAAAAAVTPPTIPTVAAVTPPAAADATPEQLRYRIVADYPHDRSAWTQGLVVAGPDRLFEGTGDWENSRLREVELSSGTVLREVALPDAQLYGEGIALLNDRIYQITWRDGLGMIYDRNDFRMITGFRYPAAEQAAPREGWGLTTDGSVLFMSDGSATIYVVDPTATADSGQLQVLRTLTVTRAGQPVERLNELEYIDGAIFANVWFEDVIVRIDPQDGRVTGSLDLSGLLPQELADGADVLNGIAYDADSGLIYVTGKYWPRLYALQLLP